ncbi:MAG: TIGR02266 family protein [Deltaproteobacteria bacterium]|nr:TIGR02266 family protein [Deltaproteobacteria bacterium]
MAESDHPSDRRTSLRAPIELRVEYKRLNSFFSDYTRNISKGGSFIRTDRPLAIGTEFVFCLVVPKLEAPLRLLGKVIWIVSTETATAEQPAGMGIEFQYRDDKERRQVESWVTRVMIDELGEEITTGLLAREANK